MRRALIPLALASTCLLTGCGASGPTAEEVAASVSAAYTSGMAAQSSADQSAAAASASRAAAATAAASSSEAARLHVVGETVEDGNGHTVTYYSTQRPAARNAPDPQDPNNEWVAIDVQACYGPGAESFDNNTSWILVDGNNGNYQPSSIGYDQFPTPKFPFGDMTVTNGQCVRGWIVYAVPIGTPLANVAYMPYGARSPVMWTP
jgi:hypothetical protein